MGTLLLAVARHLPHDMQSMNHLVLINSILNQSWCRNLDYNLRNLRHNLKPSQAQSYEACLSEGTPLRGCKAEGGLSGSLPQTAARRHTSPRREKSWGCWATNLGGHHGSTCVLEHVRDNAHLKSPLASSRIRAPLCEVGCCAKNGQQPFLPHCKQLLFSRVLALIPEIEDGRCSCVPKAGQCPANNKKFYGAQKPTSEPPLKRRRRGRGSTRGVTLPLAETKLSRGLPTALAHRHPPAVESPRGFRETSEPKS